MPIDILATSAQKSERFSRRLASFHHNMSLLRGVPGKGRYVVVGCLALVAKHIIQNDRASEEGSFLIRRAPD